MENCEEILFVIFVVILIILILLALFWIIRSNYQNKSPEKFTNEKKLCLSKAWPKRWTELLMVPPGLYTSYFQPMNIKKFTDVTFKPDLIFISVASYRDNQCVSTIQNIAKNADKPENLRFVICQQNSLLERDCLKWCKGSKNPVCKPARIERLSYHSARGPTWARWRIQQEWTGEEYFLQIDSHTRMIKGWDTILKEQLNDCPSSKPVLTQYPLEYNVLKNEKDQGDPVKEKWQIDKLRSGMYIQKFDDPDGFTRIQSDYTEEIRKYPFKSTTWAAGFSFSKGNFIIEAGYDPYTPFLFFGEEMDIAARAFTHGWDFFSPSKTVIFHNYKREHRSTFWEKPEQKNLEILSRFRIYVRLGYINVNLLPEKYKFILIKLENWPLGTERTLEEWEKMCKMDIKTEKMLNDN